MLLQHKSSDFCVNVFKIELKTLRVGELGKELQTNKSLKINRNIFFDEINTLFTIYNLQRLISIFIVEYFKFEEKPKEWWE